MERRLACLKKEESFTKNHFFLKKIKNKKHVTGFETQKGYNGYTNTKKQ
jgi:hypothetical protein